MICAESRLAILFGSIFGIIAILVVPPASTFDGPSHYFRALQVSEGSMRAERFSAQGVGGELPQSHVTFVNSLWNSYWVRHDFGTLSSWAAFSRECASTSETGRVEFTNTAVYSPVNYAFQSLGLWLSRRFTQSPLCASRMGCLFNLAGYLFMIVAVIERLPCFRRGFLLVAVSPLITIQAATFSTDGINFALPMLVLAWIWHLRASGQPVRGWALAAPFLLGLAVVLLKPTAIVALACLWLIPAGYFGSRISKISVLSAYFLCAAVLWFAWNRPYLDVDVGRWFFPGRQPMSLQKAWFLKHPLEFVFALMKFMRTGFFSQWPYFYGNVGGWIPPATFDELKWLSILLLPGLLGCGSWPGRADKAWAAGILFQSLAILVSTALALWLAVGTVGIDHIPFFVGRYLCPVYLGVAIVWAEFFHKGLIRIRSGLFWLALLGNAAGSTVILVSIASRVA